MRKLVIVTGVLLLVASGCTIHPDGEKQERQIAGREGKPFIKQVKLTLPSNPTADELVKYALLSSPELEQRYWEWRSAIEQIPQDGTQQTNLVLSAGAPITHGSTAFNRTTVTVANDPMADIVWPSKLGTAAHKALENAKAAGYRFQKDKYELRQRVLDTYYDYVLAAELLKLNRADAQILDTMATISENSIGAGMSTQSDAIKTRNEADLLVNQITQDTANLSKYEAAINSVIGRDPAADLSPDTAMLSVGKTVYDQSQLLQAVADRNPELAAVARESAGQGDAIHLAKLQYLPDFSLSISTDLAGNVQNLLGSLTAPFLRYEAINAAVAQAEANLRASNALRRQTQLDLQNRVLADVAFLTGAEKMSLLLETVILPRTRENVEIIRSSYQSGGNTTQDLFDAQRSVLAIQRLVIQLKVDIQRQNADLESAIAKPIPSTSISVAVHSDGD
jgi:outer membrane protein, heavy metal efflux system